MKKFVLALTALSALAATPAMARDGAQISFGFYAPAPAYYGPAPVAYYPPAHRVYYAPPYPARFYRHEAWEHGHRYGHRFHRGYATAWNDRGDRDGRGYNRDDHGRGEGRHR